MIDTQEEFTFIDPYLSEVNRAIAKYPDTRRQSAVLVCLDQAQRQNHDNGHYVTQAAIRHIADILQMPEIRIMEVASFFTMINLNPVGKYHIQLCGTTPCMLRGAEDILAACETHLGIKNGQTTEDNLFTLTEVECLGACCNAPMVQINDDYYEDLTVKNIITLLDSLKNNTDIQIGSQIGRICSEPEGGATTLTKTDT